ncbi:hypothetical protein [Pseudoprimorskyibacter insulae]|uniref:DUF4189 domain-containing protein n=1 Tax=Pseudoprimorskyibacter insulae TaxID=1695997 RepID=A0A2R8ANM9_9RHOB|nr:hypothetical protein [Pseudoprimorskyibacter insulae]SPF77676.1 hypothetical protein PRI8871_00260 [Pseudoprimorskyibacter insulae]
MTSQTIVRRLISAAVVASALFAQTHTATAEEMIQWTPKLTRDGQKGYAAAMEKPKNYAFALNNKSAWGSGWNFDTAEGARDRALKGCRKWVKPGQADCVVYMLNGEVVAGEQVTTKKITKRYKAISGKQAAAFFGLRDVSFAVNRSAAVAEYEKFQATGKYPANDQSLTKLLMGNSITSTANGGYAIVFDDKGVLWANKAGSNNILAVQFRQWLVTKNGLFCMFDGAFTSTGKKVGSRCVAISSIGGGKVEWQGLSYDGKPKTSFLVAGDAATTTGK